MSRARPRRVRPKADATDAQLIELCLNGDMQAWADLYFRHRTPLYAVCFHWTGDHALTEDVVHDPFVRAFEHMRSFDLERRFFPWLAAVARNRLRDIKNGVHDDLTLADAHVEPPITHAVDSTLQAILEAEVRDHVHRALAELPKNQRAAFVLSTIYELSHAQVARTLGASESAVKSLVFRARAMLRRSLNPLPVVLCIRALRARVNDRLKRGTQIASRFPVEAGFFEALGVSLALAVTTTLPAATVVRLPAPPARTTAAGQTATHQTRHSVGDVASSSGVTGFGRGVDDARVNAAVTKGDTRPGTAAPSHGNLHVEVVGPDGSVLSDSDTGFDCYGQGADLLPRSGPVRAAC